MSKIFVLCFITLILQGCAFSGKTYSNMAKGFPVLDSQKGRIFFYRDNRYRGSAIQPNLYLNGQDIGSSVPGAFFYVDMPEKTYEIECDSSKISLDIKAGKTYYIEMLVYEDSTTFFWDIRLINIIRSQAIPIINNLHYAE